MTTHEYTNDIKSKLKYYYSKCIDGLCIYSKLLSSFKNSRIQTTNDLFVFGSSVNYFINDSINIHRMQDLDLLINVSLASDIIDNLKCDIFDDLIISNNVTHDIQYSSTLLKYQGINKVININFKTMVNLFYHIDSIYEGFIDKDFDVLKIEKEIENMFYEDFVFSIDMCVYLDKLSHETVTTFGNSLLSSKKLLLNVCYDIEINNIVKSFNEIIVKKKIINKQCIMFEYTSFNMNEVYYYERSVGSLIYEITLMLKIFGENGLRDKDMEIVKKTKNVSLKKNYKYYNQMKIIFDTNIIYKFTFVKELLSFPPTKNLIQIINRLNLKKTNDFINNWVCLLIRIFGSDCILFNIMKINDLNIEKFYDIQDEYTQIQIFKTLIGYIRTQKIETTCHLCMEEFKLNTPLHLCKNGHATHLCCSLKPMKEYLLSALRRHNNESLPPLKDRQLKMCPICREDNYELIVSTESIEYNHTCSEHLNISGIVRSGNSLLDYLITSVPKDLFIEHPIDVSHNLMNGSCKKYLTNQYEYLTSC